MELLGRYCSDAGVDRNHTSAGRRKSSDPLGIRRNARSKRVQPRSTLLFIPLISIGVLLLALLLPRIDPGRENYRNFETSYWKVILAFLIYLGGFHGLICYAAAGHKVNMTSALAVMVGILLIVIGNFMGKLRPNWMIGIRTPWTLSSKRSWDKTHRLGRWVMMFMGVATGLIALSPGVEAFMIVGAIWAACFATLLDLLVAGLASGSGQGATFWREPRG